MRLLPFLVLAASPALAQTPPPVAAPRFNPRAPENTQIMPSFNFGTVESVLTQVGAKFQRSGAAGKPVLLVTFPNNRKAVVTLSSCDPAGAACKAVSIQSFWTPIANSPPQQTNLAIERFNQRYSFAKAFVAPDGRPALQRYLTADYGFIRGNLAVNLLVFADQAELFATQVLRPLEAARRP